MTYSCCTAYWLMFLHIRAGSGAPWLPWYDGGRDGSSCLSIDVCVVRDMYVTYTFPSQ